MIKKTVKRGLAFTLAASLAFGAAPFAGASLPNAAFAAETSNAYTKTKSVTLTTGDVNSFALDGFAATLQTFTGAAGIKITSEDPTVAGLAKVNSPESWGDELTISTNEDPIPDIHVNGLKAGNTTITIVAVTGSGKVIENSSQTIDVSVSDLEKSVVIKDKNNEAINDGATISMVDKKSAEVSVDLNNISYDDFDVKTSYTTKGIYIEDTSIATAAYADKKITFTGAKPGTTKVYVYLPDENIRRQFTLEVVADTVLNATIDGATYSIDVNKNWSKDEKAATAPVIYLNNSVKNALINVTSSNGKPVTFTSTGDIVVGNDGSISAKLNSEGKVTPGNAKVTFSVAADADKDLSAIDGVDVNVVITSDAVKVSKVEAFDSSDNSLGKSEGSFAVEGGNVVGTPGAAAADADQKVLKLSTKDKTSETFRIDSNIDEKFIDIAIKSGAEYITLEGKTITAVKAGLATIEIKAKGDESTLANTSATVIFKVQVFDKNVNNVITASDITLTKDNPTAKIEASATHGNKLNYYLAKEVDGKLVATTKDSDPNYDIAVNSLTGEVTYKNTDRSGFTYVAIVAVDNVADSVKPEDAFVKVTYKESADVEEPEDTTPSLVTNPITVKGKTVKVKYAKLKKKNQTVKASAAVKVTDAVGKITYKKKSGNKKITIAKSGKITVKKGLKKGTYKVKVTIKAAGNDAIDAGSKVATVKIKVTK